MQSKNEAFLSIWALNSYKWVFFKKVIFIFILTWLTVEFTENVMTVNFSRFKWILHYFQIILIAQPMWRQSHKYHTHSNEKCMIPLISYIRSLRWAWCHWESFLTNFWVICTSSQNGILTSQWLTVNERHVTVMWTVKFAFGSWYFQILIIASLLC